MSRAVKRLLMLGADAVAIPLALYIGFALRLGTVTPPVAVYWWLFLLLPLLSLPVFAWLGYYRMVVRYMGPQAVSTLLKGVTVSTLILAAVTFLAGLHGFPRSVLPLYWLLALLGIGGSRALVRGWLQRGRARSGECKQPVIIYGAGSAGAQLAGILAGGPRYLPVAFIDDDPGVQGSVIRGVGVYPPARLEELIGELGVTHVLLAVPSAAPSRRQAILRRLERYPVHVKTIPALADVVSGKARLDEIREVAIEDLLGRDTVAASPKLMAACIAGKAVLVTGAGGSIGAELCRQIVRERPRRLVLLERSEYALYELERELAEVGAELALQVELVPLLGSVTDRGRLLQVMQGFAVDTVYHAAAYKHVPIVEHNVIEGVHNNALGTWYAADAAREAGVETFVLISTDKAVRPANVMGASKRLAEMLLQALAEDSGGTTFCMVRFGNVLGSSGSVVPLFREQIRRGGPITVTHPEITRYFMTIPEAASLVIQAGAMARGGEVFVLDMGAPVRIVDLARKLVRLMGCRLRDDDHPDGDIEIRYTGLRPGEKLYEELLIGDNVTGTDHPKIFRAREQGLALREARVLLGQLQSALEQANCEAVRRLLERVVTGYAALEPLPDLLYRRHRA